MEEGAAQVPELFQRLFREHYPEVARKLYALTGDYAAAEDLAQEVFLRLYLRPPDRLEAVGAWLHRVLTRLEAENPRRCRIVECRVFGGMTIEEAAEALSISPATVKREWQIASAQIYRELEAARGTPAPNPR